MSAEERLRALEERNSRVEQEKAWEQSISRKFFIAFLTYTTVALFLLLSGFANPLLNAIVPTIGFVLSTLTLPFLKKVWLQKMQKDQF